MAGVPQAGAPQRKEGLMPRLPEGMVKRKRKGYSTVYYWRRQGQVQENGKTVHKDQRRSLGTDLDVALTTFDELLKNPPPFEPEPEAQPVLTVEALSRRWLDEYVKSKRTPRGQAQAEQQTRDYLLPHLGSVPVSDLKPADI